MGDPYLDIVKQYPGEGVIALDSLGRQFLIVSPRLLADMLVHKCYDFSKIARITSFLRLIVGDGLVNVEEDQHRFLRKNTMPAFHIRHIMDLYPMMWRKASILKRTLESKVASEDGKGQVVEMGTWATKVTLDIIGVACMGRELNTIEKASDPLLETLHWIFEPAPEKILFGLLTCAFGYPAIKLLPWKLSKLYFDLTTKLKSMGREIIKEKKEAMQTKAGGQFDIMSLLINSNNFDDEALKDQLLTLLVAG